MELRQLYTFIRVAQLESFSKAAESLDYSQSAVTVQIHQLEEELNTRLFDRMGKRIALTNQGRRFLPGAYNTIFEANRAKSSIMDSVDLLGHLSIGVIDSLCSSALPPILHRIRVEHPGITVQITIDSPEGLIRKMDLGELDLIYILDAPRYDSHWCKQMEKEEPVVFVASNDLQQELAGKEELRVTDLLRYPFFLTEREANYRRALDHYISSKDRMLVPAVEVTDVSFILRMLKISRGVSFLPWFVVEEDVRQRKLTVLNVTDLKVKMYRQIFHHKAKWKTPEMDEFIRLAHLELENPGPGPDDYPVPPV